MATIPRLSIAAIEGARSGAEGQPLFLWEGLLPGFGVRITSSVRSFVVQSRNNITAKTERITLGRFPALSLEHARIRATSLLRPTLQATDQHTVHSLMQSFITNYIEKRHKPKTKKTELQLIRDHVLPHLGTLQLCELTRPIVTEWHSDKIAAPIAANRALAHLSKACSYAIARDWMQYNPCHGIERNPELIKDRFFTDAELTTVFGHLRTKHPDYFLPCAALLLTGMRCSELLGDFTFDSQRKIIRLTDSKTGAKSIPLNEHANSFFEFSIPIEFSIPNSIGYRRMYDAFKNACFLSGIRDVSLHTLRHTLATYMAEHGDSTFQIAAMGGWKTLAMVQRYVSLHGVGTPHPTPAGERIARAIGL